MDAVLGGREVPFHLHRREGGGSNTLERFRAKNTVLRSADAASLGSPLDGPGVESFASPQLF